MKSSEIRERFLSFFEKRKHKVIPSSSLVPDDPTLLLTGAGMIQFKPIFQGEVKSSFSRAATAQKCIRTTDIGRVGETARHLTFFEMLGNFSFGDYYKKEAISWAWEFLVEDLRFDPEKLWITVYKDDDEAFSIWKEQVGVPEKKIVRLGEGDNFWSAGPTGPCGPCSELIYDLGEEKGCGKETCGVDCDCDRYLEVWNLVFMQYNREEDGTLKELPRKNIDTGLGLERAASLLQNVPTNFETDLLKPVIDKIADLSGLKYGKDSLKDVSFKIIADHIRAITFMVGDGILPSNESRGYILRRLVRRAIRHGRLLGLDKPFLPELITTVVDLMGGVYPELKEHYSFATTIAKNEEKKFLKTLKQGLNILDEVMEKTRKQGGKVIPGDAAFQLYDTYGFPLELTKEIGRERDLQVDEKTFSSLMEKQREKARAAWKGEASVNLKKVYNQVLEESGKTNFEGYSKEVTDSEIQFIITQENIVPVASSGDEVEVVLDKTPFYAEMGGQAGDKGFISTSTGKVKIIDTKAILPDFYLHQGEVIEGTIETGQKAKAEIDVLRREAIRRNHTATHLLQWALRRALGEHVKQAGSLVEEDRFRFDFNHFEALSEGEIKKVEKLVNKSIFQAHSVKCYTTSLEYAKESGALALFGEKYSQFVRVVEVGNFSKELCGGTHVSNTSQIGVFKILGERSVGVNIRRIEAATSLRASEYLFQQEDLLKEAAGKLKTTPAKMGRKIDDLLSELKIKEGEIKKIKLDLIKSKIDEFLDATQELDGIKVLLKEVKAKDMDSLRSYIDVLRNKVGKGIVVLGASSLGKALLVAYASKELVKDGFNARSLLEKVAPIVKGGGGGRSDLAQAGGKNPHEMAKALEEAWNYIKDWKEKNPNPKHQNKSKFQAPNYKQYPNKNV